MGILYFLTVLTVPVIFRKHSEFCSREVCNNGCQIMGKGLGTKSVASGKKD